MIFRFLVVVLRVLTKLIAKQPPALKIPHVSSLGTKELTAEQPSVHDLNQLDGE